MGEGDASRVVWGDGLGTGGFGRLRAEGGGFQTGFQRLKGVKYTAAAHTTSVKPLSMSWA
jgi:hypothetical protein